MNKIMYDLVNGIEPYNEEESIQKDVMLDFISKYEDVLTRDNKIAHFTTSGWIVNKDRTKVLMIYHNIYDSWAWVGGHADGDSDLLHVVKKEIEEETGITNVKLLSDKPYGLNVLTVDPHYKRGKYVNSHLHFDIEYLFEADEDDIVRIKEDENSGVKWVPLNEVKDYSTENKMKPVYQRLTDKLELFK